MGKKSLKLKGLTIKIGGDTSDLNKSLDSVQKKGSGLGNELKEINRLLKLDPTNTEMLAQKQQVLAQSIGNTEEKLALLKNAEKMAQEQFAKGDISEEQYRALQREILSAENHLEGLKKQAKQTDDAIENLGKDAGKAGDKIKEQGDKTEKTEKNTRDMDDAANDLASGGLAAVVAGATAALTAIVALAEETREYRTEMGKLGASFTDNGHSAEVATKTYKALQGVVGDTDQAVEAANHLSALCDSEAELADWTQILTGVYARWGASLSVESLAEAANETLRCGTVTGSFADSLNWAADAGETFGVKLRAATEENEEWNAAVMEAKTAEDFFNLALQECSTTQERQQLITKTLTELYGDAAEQYRTTNAELIESNEVADQFRRVTAEIGEAVEPVITDIRKLGVTLLKDTQEPMKATTTFIQKSVLPAIRDTGDWTRKNSLVIKSGLTAVTAGMVAYKAATIATTVAQKGLKGAIMATEIAQKALAAAQAATPWGLILTAVTAATSALVALTLAAQKAEGPVNVLTDEEKKLMEAADEAAEAFRDQQKATNETLRSITANMEYIGDLSDELFTLADASGKVKAEDEARAQFILNEMNEALDTEYQMIDGVIQQYDTLKASIESVMQAKLANMLLESAKADYVAAREGQDPALESATLHYEEYQAQLAQTQKAEEKYKAFAADYNKNITSGAYALSQTRKALDDFWLAHLQAKLENEKELLAEKEDAYNKSTESYGSHYNTIATYEEAQQAVLEGNYQKAIELLSLKGGAYGVYSDKVDEETAHVLDTLYKEAIDAGLKAELTKKNFEDGVDGYTEAMVTEAETNYRKALDKFANAYADAESVGEDLTQGMTDGAENKRSGLLAKARSLVAGFLKAARAEADCHSPSRKSIAIFEDIGEGAEIGIENKTKDVKRAGTEQAAAVLDAYREQEVSAQRVMRNVEHQQEAYTTAGISAAGSYAPLLEQILTAINDGKVLLLDGEAVVGGTVNRMDNRLGALQVLADRGAT